MIPLPVVTNTALLVAAALLLAAGGFVAWWRRRPRDPEEIERRRRAYLNQVGRIVEGHIVEITDALPAEPLQKPNGLFSRKNGTSVRSNGGGHSAAHPLVVYAYSISGVSYETAQDISGLEERACLAKIVAGQHASVKYDPANPSNSILIADNWSGLH